MAQKTYTPVMSSYKLIDIMEFLHQQSTAVSAAEIARGLELPHGTVMSHLSVLLERKWVRMSGALYEPGNRISALYAAYVQALKHKRHTLDGEIATLGG
ncbi:helix-turn-helix domain-containing protein [Chrysiogenes arsenatis]|uniref:helix-turn-helix domain-containing protein n=1 Tax=Chrysiogenes arsenatis TaxID=309797 RepID=UPI00040EF2E7|nr:helix-turn-helix domain-containing protein [Chrysiogenes arsenatis]